MASSPDQRARGFGLLGEPVCELIIRQELIIRSELSPGHGLALRQHEEQHSF